MKRRTRKPHSLVCPTLYEGTVKELEHAEVLLCRAVRLLDAGHMTMWVHGLEKWAT